MERMNHCQICPRACLIDRTRQKGYCGTTEAIKIARAALHFWEEPCISGLQGSGAVFFSGCNLHCVFCQNQAISTGSVGKVVDVSRLAEIFLELESQKAHNINLVTPSHYIPQLAQAIELAKKQGISIPFVYNTGSYESVESLKQLDGLIDIYLPDLKYYDGQLSAKYSHAADYFTIANKALAEMYRQVGDCVFGDQFMVSDHIAELDASELDASETHLLKKGMIVRHLVLPGALEDSKKILTHLNHTYGNHIYISLMSQFTPLDNVSSYPELNRTLSPAEYDQLVDFCIELDLENVFIQGGEVATESFIPDFDGTGV